MTYEKLPIPILELIQKYTYKSKYKWNKCIGGCYEWTKTNDYICEKCKKTIKNLKIIQIDN